MIAWIVAVLLIKDVKDRRLVVIAGVIPDIDAILLLVNEELFYEYHHTIGHSFLFGIPLALLFSAKAKQRFPVFFGCMAAFSLHILADYFGSNWPIPLLYPLSSIEVSSAGYLSYYTMYSIINPLTAIVSMLTIFLIIWMKEISPFEFISQKLDRRLVGLYTYPLKYRCGRCPTLALFSCDRCSRKICWEHMGSVWKGMCVECMKGGDETGPKEKEL